MDYGNPRKLGDRDKQRLRDFPHLGLPKGRPSEDEPAPVSTFSGKPPKVHIAQLTINQAVGYDPAA